MTYWALRIARKLSFLLPVRISYAVAAFLSWVAWQILPVQRENAIDNMARVLGLDREDSIVRRKARASFRYYSMYMVDFLRLPGLREEELDANLQFVGWDHIDSALEAGKGVIFISAHIGNWDLAASAIARRGYQVNVVAETFQPKKLNDLVQGHRAGQGMKVIPLENASRRVLTALRKNEILGLLIDRPSPESGVLVQFFGGLTEVPGGAALLALKTGAKLISGVLVRNSDHTYSGFITSPSSEHLTGDQTTDVGLLTQRIMDSMEGFIRQYPEQWFIFRPMSPKNLAAKA